MAAKNDITGASIQSKPTSKKFRDGWDAIWGKKDEQLPTLAETENEGEAQVPVPDVGHDTENTPKPE